jgi:hypothetical protein
MQAWLLSTRINLMRRQAMSLQSSSHQEPVFRPQPKLQLGGAILEETGRKF